MIYRLIWISQISSLYIFYTPDFSCSEADSGGRGGHAPPFFCNHFFFFFCNHFEELQTVLFEVELLVNNARLTYVYPSTIETCLTITASVIIFWIGGDMSLREKKEHQN